MDGDPPRLNAALKPLFVFDECEANGRLTESGLRDGAFRLLSMVKDTIGPCAVSTRTAEYRQLVVPVMGAIFAFCSLQKSGQTWTT